MPIRTTVDIPDPLHERLRSLAEKSGASIRSLIVRAIEQHYPAASKDGGLLNGPLLCGGGKLGEAFPEDENPHDFIFS